MNTPIADFVRRYAASGTARLHMPGHKGRAFLGCEALDITEIAGADSLYEADGIIRESEENASALFGTARKKAAVTSSRMITTANSACLASPFRPCKALIRQKRLFISTPFPKR